MITISIQDLCFQKEQGVCRKTLREVVSPDSLGSVADSLVMPCAAC